MLQNEVKCEVSGCAATAVIHGRCYTHLGERISLIVPENESTSALRYDSAKPRFDLIPPDALEDLAKLYEFGARKYSERNWEKGMDWGKCLAALMRHAWAWASGQDLDPESGLHHMTHAAWNALALVSYSKRQIGKDNRK
jgi:hypothetical protein